MQAGTLVAVALILAAVQACSGKTSDDPTPAPEGGGTVGGSGSGGAVSSGGAPSGGTSTGGVSSGGVSTGGVSSGGTATGGVSKGGAANGGGSGGEAGEPPCVREYDLPSYAGSTEGLCPAAEVNKCDCYDVGAAEQVVCTPDGSACSVQHGVCEDRIDCGWHGCDSAADSQTDPFCADLVPLIDMAEAFSLASPRCVRDEDCLPPKRCTRRVYNVMVCD